MTRTLPFVILIVISNSLLGQNITFDQVISFYKKKLPQAEETLSAKNWELIRAEEPGGIVMGTSVFAFEKTHSMLFI